jgi:serine/threonine protein kinase
MHSTLREYLRTLPPLPEAVGVGILLQILIGVDQLAKSGLLHRNLTLDAVFVETCDQEVPLVQIGSFEHLAQMEDQHAGHVSFGNPDTTAPELFELGKGRSGVLLHKAEVWSCAILFLDMFHLPKPLPPHYEACELEAFPASFSPVLRDCLRRMLCTNVAERMDPEQAILSLQILKDGKGW